MKPTMSMAVDKNQLNEQLVEYYQLREKQLEMAVSIAVRLIVMNEDEDSINAVDILETAVETN